MKAKSKEKVSAGTYLKFDEEQHKKIGVICAQKQMSFACFARQILADRLDDEYKKCLKELVDSERNI
jgi:hypothetical protein